jgi:hypothetical protein
MIPDLVIILVGAVPLAVFLVRSVRDLKPAQIGDGQAIFPEGRVPVEL